MCRAAAGPNAARRALQLDYLVLVQRPPTSPLHQIAPRDPRFALSSRYKKWNTYAPGLCQHPQGKARVLAQVRCIHFPVGLRSDLCQHPQDEVHERDLHSDFLLMIARELLTT